jgi:hypothetical protein
MLKDLLEQGEDKRYSLNKNGYIAYQILSYAKESLSKPRLPTIRRRRIAESIKPSALAFYKLLFHPTKAFAEVQERPWSYVLPSLTIFAFFVASTPSISTYSLTRSLTCLLALLVFSLAFARLAYGKRTKPLHLTASVFISHLPAIILNLLTIFFTTFEFPQWMPLPFIVVEDPGYVVLMQIFAALFVWRFVLLFLAMRESFKLTVGQSFVTVFASSIFENLMAFIVDYLFKIPSSYL